MIVVCRDVDKNDDGFLDKDELSAMLDAVGMPKDPIQIPVF